MLNTLEINHKQYRIVEKLGEGSFGKVYKVIPEIALSSLSDAEVMDSLSPDTLGKINIENSSFDSMKSGKSEPIFYVVKRIESKTIDLTRHIKNEIQTLKFLTRTLENDSPFNKLIDFQIIKYSQNLTRFYLVLEYLKGRDLLNFLKTRSLTMSDIAVIFRKIVLAVNYLHIHEIIHRDLKLENILISEENDQYYLKILDFGFVCNRNPDYLFEHIEDSDIIAVPHSCQRNLRVGSEPYMAPELFLPLTQLKFNDLKKSDVWACGVILYTLIYKTFPFKAFKTTSYSDQLPKLAKKLEDTPTIFNDLLFQMLKPLDSRATLLQVIPELEKIGKRADELHRVQSAPHRPRTAISGSPSGSLKPVSWRDTSPEKALGARRGSRPSSPKAAVAMGQQRDLISRRDPPNLPPIRRQRRFVEVNPAPPRLLPVLPVRIPSRVQSISSRQSILSNNSISGVK